VPSRKGSGSKFHHQHLSLAATLFVAMMFLTISVLNAYMQIGER
jgi:hypothetical protein